jgi:hypothetical protein
MYHYEFSYDFYVQKETEIIHRFRDTFFTFFLVPLLLEKINAEHEKWEIPQQLNLWWRKS